MTILGRVRVGAESDRSTYDASPRWWVKYAALIAIVATLVAGRAFVAGGWWRLLTPGGVILIAVLLAAAIRWERDHKRPPA
jgi:hypothetical protein